ncbi:ATP-dependent RNA helicase [Coemansia thaxteri]|uniref:RNA helicase n=1 Tax=Coemansia thaxteri TaxID=2663907 RepID=A0A9W8BK92_9FUNG|nr:ATP-dependent RNA helicase [Coemansia thaxteri]KAJ2003889.1 ATP-dependent RNA helicase [Coemansia thaxteri]KAJ2484438.1 ATP-dependent RNA helicase [Coemansia sp. RSA 2320]
MPPKVIFPKQPDLPAESSAPAHSKKHHAAKRDYRTLALQLKPQREGLPIFSARASIIQQVRSHPTVIIVGETGSGKTTQIPQYLLESGFTSNTRAIAVTQPRRVAATSIAKRVAEEVGTSLGGRVGYTIRFEDCSSDKTRLRFCTDGLLLREILSDPLLRRYSVVILDEAHERTLRTDILLGMLKDIQRERARLALLNQQHLELTETATRQYEEPEDHQWSHRDHRSHGTHVTFDTPQEPEKEEEQEEEELQFEDQPTPVIDDVHGDVTGIDELKVIVMSATLDAERFSGYFDSAPILYVAGRQFPVTTYYTTTPQADYLDSAHLATLQIHTETPSNSGDVLVFLSGQEDIENVERLLLESAASFPPGVPALLPCPIFAALPQAQQSRVFDPAPEFTRKIILATNIAETSLTIPGIRHVIDSGVHKVRGFDPRIGESLLVEPISKSSARQRTGRAGREAAGFCYRLYTEADYAQLAEDSVPEIKRCQLSMVVLQLKAAGVADVMQFNFMDRPSKKALKHALLELFALEALDDHGELTAMGRWMSEFPLEPTYAKVIYASQKAGCTREAIDVVSLLSVDSLFYVPADKREESNAAQLVFKSTEGDHLTFLNLLRAYTKVNGDREWCQEHFVNRRNMRHVLDVRQQLNRLCARLGLDIDRSCGTDLDAVLKCFLSGFFHNCALLQPDGTYRSLSGSQTVHIHPGSSLFAKKVPAIFYDQLVFTNKLHARAVSAADPLWIAQASPKLYGRLNSGAS